MKNRHILSPYLFPILAIGMMAFVLTLASPVSAASADDFIITVKTDNTGVSTSTQFTIPTNGTGYNYNVDCDNDGTDEATAQTGDYTCNYAAAGTYTIRIKDNSGTLTGFPRIYFNYSGDKLKLLTIEQWGRGQWTSMEKAFYGCANLTSTAADTPDLSLVTNMSYMFNEARAFNGPIGGWDTTSVTDMSKMFDSTKAFNQDIGRWNTSNVINMMGMFDSAIAFNQDIGGWNTSNVNNMGVMFLMAPNFNQDIGGWNTSSVIYMGWMFFGARTFNQDIGNWNTSSVNNMNRVFFYATAFDQDLGRWNVAGVTDAASMFDGVTLSTANYDALLIGWDTQTLQPNVTFSGGNSTYCFGNTARENMANNDNWAITDGGMGCVITIFPLFMH